MTPSERQILVAAATLILEENGFRRVKPAREPKRKRVRGSARSHHLEGDPDRHFVYIMEAAGRLKVGYTKNLDQRRNTIQNGSADRVRVAFYVSCDRAQAKAIEKATHQRLRRHHVSGEWFRAPYQEAKSALKASFDAVIRQTTPLRVVA